MGELAKLLFEFNKLEFINTLVNLYAVKELVCLALNICLLFELFIAYWFGVPKNYRLQGAASICLSMSVAIAYTANPFDLVPDFIPIVGYLDDFKVCLMVAQTWNGEIVLYKQWRLENVKHDAADEQLKSKLKI